MSRSNFRRKISTLAHVATFIAAAFLLGATPLVVPSFANAQTFRGSIVGTVTDVNGGAIPDALVAARNVATGLARTTTTDSGGSYSIPELPIGPYEVTVTKANFKTARVTDVKVEVAGERRADVTLEVSGGAEAVEISRNAVQVETTTNTPGGTFRSTGETSPSSSCSFPEPPVTRRELRIRPDRSGCSAQMETEGALTTTCSTAPI